MRITAWIFCILFIYIMKLQLNDPDGIVWILIYAYPAVLSAMVGLNKLHLKSHFWGAIIFFIAALIYLPLCESYNFNNERFREAGGLLLCGLWLIATYRFVKKSASA